MTYAIAAAGTGGHVFPALAIAEALISRGATHDDIVVFGGDRMEASVFPAQGFPFVQLELQGLHRSFSPRNLLLPVVVARAVRAARTALVERDVRVVLGMGSYVTVPVGWAARRAGIPLYLHEQNADAGLANRVMARAAEQCFVSFADTSGLPQGVLVGNPVRANLAGFSRAGLRHEALQRYGLSPGPVVIGVFGGSQGAGSLNRALASMVAGWTGTPVQVLHLTGPAHADNMRSVSRGADVPWKVVGFEEDMQYFYAACDIVVSRAGGAVAELAVTGTPAVLVPGSFGGGHQKANAARFERAGAAVVVAEERLGELADVLRPLVDEPQLPRSMAEYSRTPPQPSQPGCSMLMVDLTVPCRIHIVGAGGAGMSGLAKLLSQMGHTVSGSDLKMSTSLAGLQDLGIDVWEGSRPQSMTGFDLLVASSAVPPGDEEVVAARLAGTDIWERPRLLRELTAGRPTIGATGTHGKTTSTAMLVAAVRAGGLDPSFLVGGELTDLRTNAALGADDLLVLEVDEAFGTFLDLSINGLMVTNIEPDHLDFYHTLDRLEDAFAEVVRSVDGPVVVGIDDPGGRRLAERTQATTYGTAPEADWQIVDVTPGASSVEFRLRGPHHNQAVTVGRPGFHIARDAGGALALLGELGLDLDTAAEGLRLFAGVRRRFELRGHVGGVTLIDDYAHHPTEIAATLQAIQLGSWSTVWAVFQPHRYTRTRELHREFGGAFTGADHVVVTDVFAAGEPPEPGVTGALVADAVEARSEGEVHYVAHRSELAGYLAERVRPGDVVVTLGAGDITALAGELAPLLEERS